MTEGSLTVKVTVPLSDYRLLNAEATRHKRTVAEIIQARITTPRHGGSRPGSGVKSKYTTEMGHRIQAARLLNMSWLEVSMKLGIPSSTARDWLKKFETESGKQ